MGIASGGITGGLPPYVPPGGGGGPLTLADLLQAAGFQEAASIFASLRAIPVGTVCGSLLQPEDVGSPWLVADGHEISRVEYKPLWDAIGEHFGAGDGSTTFNLPDLRDKFWYGTPGVDPAGQTVDKKPTATTTATVDAGALGAITVSEMNVFYLTPIILGR